MRVVYYPESVGTWEATLLLQTGAGLPTYSGLPYQRGHGGIGNFFRGLFRAIFPAVKRALPHIGREILKTGSDVATDVIRHGQPVAASVKRRGRQAIGRSLSTVGSTLQENGDQSGSGLGRRPHVNKVLIKRLASPRKTHYGKRKKRMRHSADIF